MRVLFLYHRSLEESDVGLLVKAWGESLAAAGNEVHILTADHRSHAKGSLSVERMICREGDSTADVPFDVPQFSSPRGPAPTLRFVDLTDSQLAQYRDRLRRRLDTQIDQFDPAIIHVQHIWLGGQLALETGVPYVLNAWRPEWSDYEHDVRFRALADQAAENAGAILVPDETMHREVAARFAVSGRTLVMPKALESTAPSAESSTTLLDIYQNVLDQRFGREA